MLVSRAVCPVVRFYNLFCAFMHERSCREKSPGTAVIRIRMRDYNLSEPAFVAKPVVGEHRHDIVVINTVTGIDHQGLIRGREDIDASAAGHLETEKINYGSYRNLLDIGIEIFSCCGSHCSAGQKHAVKDLAGIISPVHQFLCDMVGIGQKREQEGIL